MSKIFFAISTLILTSQCYALENPFNHVSAGLHISNAGEGLYGDEDLQEGGGLRVPLLLRPPVPRVQDRQAHLKTAGNFIIFI